MPDKSLKSKTVHGMGWSAVDNVSKLGITFVVGIILARLLSPDEYGLIGILTIFISIFNAIVDSGFSNALIRKQDANDVDYSTAFITNMVLSLLMALALYLCAEPIANFFGREELAPMTRVLSSVIVINAVSLVPKAKLSKDLDFKTQTKVTIIATLLSGSIGIGMAYAGFGVWSLVWQQISMQLATSLLLWLFVRWIPAIRFSKKSFNEMWSFGWKLLVSALLDTAWKEIYQVVIGKCYSPAALGLYTRANQFAALPSSNLTMVVQRVSFPALSSIQDDKVRLKSAYKRVICTTMLATFALMLGMAACAKSMIIFLIGEQWVGCVLMLQLVIFNMMLYPLHAINLNMLQVQGRSDLFLKLEIIKKTISIGPILLGIFIGIYCMLIASVLTGLISYYLNAYYSGSFLDYDIIEQVRDILPSLGIAIAMAIPVYLMELIPISAYILFPLQLIVGTLLTILMCEKVHLPEYQELKGILISAIHKAENKI